ncbi:ATP-binding protein [Candidatus Vondammii sp. HM_W22]|uniref:ATP-binding protein n=1 Tax=Candidatus Vondammii sp. HM_W22 TaxID=2687299 RepID=UPI002E7BDBB3|nr:ATP-binding protein [Candidatus Vondammii sp. HM_W22]
MNRTRGLPGIIEFHGPSGFGKSTAAAHVAMRLSAYFVMAQSNWTKKAFLLAILEDMRIVPLKTIPELVKQIAQQLSLSQRPLIIDEAGLLLDREGGANLIKDLYEASQGTLMLIGEELLPNRIQRWERLDGRVLDWVPAQGRCPVVNPHLCQRH